MKYVGAHVSAAGGVYNAPLSASKLKAKAFAFFTKNQKQWKAKPLTVEEISLFKKNLAESGIDPYHVLPHDSYLINLGNPDPEKRAKSLEAFTDEILRASQLGLKYVNFHPGSHLKEITEEQCLDLISDSMNTAYNNSPDSGVTQVIEITAGQGSNVGYKFEHIKRLIDNFNDKKNVGVCIDTAHAFSAGYDLSTPDKFEKVMNEFDRIIGLKYLKAFHLNDSKKDFGSKVDRHAPLGEGTLGIEPFRYIMNQSVFDNIPLILETPDPELWEGEIRLLYSLEI
ncbi:MAG: deoxyribonuclease IV [Spirochaetia bacterium]|jgi:deoxyribonuclease-4|nr:deoxyribonuclease IV [Spirochaetia bacterium]